MIDPAVEKIMQSELIQGEKLIWCDRPSRPVIAGKAILGLIIAVLWCIMVTLIFVLTFLPSETISTPLETPDISTIVAAIGFFAFFSFFLIGGINEFWNAITALIAPSKELYAITSKRGIIKSRFGKGWTASLSPECLRNREVTGTDEIGTLIFERKLQVAKAPFGSSVLTAKFNNIKNPRLVETVIHSTFQNHNAS